MSMRVEHDYYSVPVWLMQDYLTQLGGRSLGENVMEGDGWRAELRKAEPKHIGSLRVGGATVVFSGEQATLDLLFERLHWKTLRGGG
ncbi:MAG TPA: DUF1952 domain-containing protein [Chloroflexi bacterium]|nr:DUF1952 domain-containing protein [Chloroflexota bacterium]